MKYWGILLLCVVILVSGCKSKQVESVEVEAEEENVIIEAEDMEDLDEEELEELTEELSYVTPLSGELSEEPVLNRPIVVTINNHPLARPQSGIQQADLIFEMLAEGNITRLLAVYQSELPGKVGPIRSARDYFITISKGLKAFYVAHGYSPDAQTMLNRGEIEHINGMQYDGTYFHRSTDRKAPHNSYSTGEDIVNGAAHTGANLQLEAQEIPTLSFDDQPLETVDTEPVSNITVSFSNDLQFINEFDYHPTTGFYSRTTAGQRTIDAESGEELELANVVFLEMPHRVIDSQGRLAVDLDSHGNAWLFRDGKLQKGEWTNEEGHFILQSNGELLSYKPGQTWIHLIPTHRGLDNMVMYTE